jgi:hypothetical protein
MMQRAFKLLRKQDVVEQRLALKGPENDEDDPEAL